jgi:hypothetical protein
MELLLGIAGIAVLAALRLPTLGHAKEKACRGSYLSNTGRMGVTVQVHAEDKRDSAAVNNPGGTGLRNVDTHTANAMTNGTCADTTPGVASYEDADALDLAEGHMAGGASASPWSVLRSQRPQTRLEASCTRTGRPPGRLGPKRVSRLARERESRTAGMHALEESDYAIVPTKLLNNEGRPSAEAVEGRAWPKENTARSHTFPTQSGGRRVPGVGRCAAGKSAANISGKSPMR